jgi:hypothetical protein
MKKKAEAKADYARNLASLATYPQAAIRRGTSPSIVAESMRARNLRAIKASSSASEQTAIYRASGAGAYPGERSTAKYAPLTQEEKRMVRNRKRGK